MTNTTTILHDARSEQGECYYWRHIVRRTSRRIIISDYTNRQATADEIDLLERNGYSHDDAEDAHVVAQRDGATLYHMRHAGYAIEGETGEMLADIDAESAIRNWRRS